MAKDKTPAPAEGEEDALTKRIDDMMDVNRPDAVTAKPAATAGNAPIDIFKDKPSPLTAPKLSSKLRKEVEVKAVESEPKISPKPVETPNPKTEDAADEQPAAEDPAPVKQSTELDDPATEEAVTDIVAKEGDELLAIEDARVRKATPVAKDNGGFKDKLRGLFKNKWTWIVVVLILGVVFGLQTTRYKVLGLVLKGNAEVTVIDSKTSTPVSNAEVSVAGVKAKTDGTGKVSLHVHLGSDYVKVTKQYYQDYDGSGLVGFGTSNLNVKLVATGRQVPITVNDKVTGQPLSGAEIKVLDTTAKTDDKGRAIVVVPTKSATDTATVSLDGYNNDTFSIQVTDKVVNANTLALTPAGRIYFLSNQSGKIDVVRTDLDGANRKVILAGTGSEDPNTTSLLAARDWKYLVLESAREGGSQPSLYLINTSDDSVSKFATNDANYSLLGWSNHYFVYEASYPDHPNWQSGATLIKSYNADSGKTITLATNSAAGTSNSDATYQVFLDAKLLDSSVYYDMAWYTYPGTLGVSGKQNSIMGVHVDGSGTKTLKSVDSTTGYYSNFTVAEPDLIYLVQYNNNSSSASYYTLNNSGGVSPTNTVTASSFNKTYPTYLQSPTGGQYFWTDYRDGKNTLFLGTNDTAHGTQIASLSDYSPFGWFSDKYLLATKNGSELYIMPAGKSSQPPLKISDYYKPQLVYPGYGGGYGGL